jgi:hypothetical protein
VEHMLTATVANPVAAVAGFAAMVCLAVWPIFRARSTMLAIYIGNNLGFVLHYALLELWTAAAMNALLALQTGVAIGIERWPRLRMAYYALIPVVAGLTLVTWYGWPSILAAAATALSTVGRIQRNEMLFRALLLATTPLWAMHDLVVGSLPGFAADILSMLTGAIMLLACARTIGAPMPRKIQQAR